VGAHNYEQKHPNRYTRPGIADFVLQGKHGHLASGSFGGNGKEKTATGLTSMEARTHEHAPLDGQGWRAGFCCATCGAVNFRFSDWHHTSGNHGADWPPPGPRAPVWRPSADLAQPE
jgi:hypothetical protein